jgi:L-lactate permease
MMKPAEKHLELLQVLMRQLLPCHFFLPILAVFMMKPAEKHLELLQVLMRHLLPCHFFLPILAVFMMKPAEKHLELLQLAQPLAWMSFILKLAERHPERPRLHL